MANQAGGLVVAVVAVVRNDRGEILLIERTDNGLWALPGGAQEIGESVKDAVRREVREETGIEVEVTGLTGIYSDPAHVIAYDDGEVRQSSRHVLRPGRSRARCGLAPSHGKHDGFHPIMSVA